MFWFFKEISGKRAFKNTKQEQDVEAILKSYLTKEQAIEKYSFLTRNMLKNLLFKDIGGFRSKVVKKLGRRIILDEEAFLLFLSNCSENEVREGEDRNG